MKKFLQGSFDQLLAMWLSLVLSLLQIFLIRGKVPCFINFFFNKEPIHYEKEEFNC